MLAPLADVHPISHPSSGPSSKCAIGATVTGVDLNELSQVDFEIIEAALYKYKVVVIKGQQNLDFDKEFEFVHRFDPEAPADRGHGTSDHVFNGKPSLLGGIENKFGAHPEVRLVGNGPQGPRFDNLVLEQACHVTYHKTPLTDKQRRAGFTRWFRFHMDAALFRTSPPVVTALLALAVPKGPDLTVLWDDGSDQSMKIAPGTTGFVAGSTVYQLLSPEQRAIADNSRVEYAPHPYTFIGGAKGNSNGLGLVSEGKEVPIDDLPPWDPKEIKSFPMVWHNPQTGEKSFQVHSVAVHKMFLRSSPDAPEILVDDLVEIRRWLYEVQRPAFDSQYVFAPAHSEGDVILFYNRGLYHSATDYGIPEYGHRTLLQAHIGGSVDPR